MVTADQPAEPKAPSSILWKTLGTFLLGLPILLIAAGMVYDYVQSRRAHGDPISIEAPVAQPQPARDDPQKNIKEQYSRLPSSSPTAPPSNASTTDVQ